MFLSVSIALMLGLQALLSFVFLVLVKPFASSSIRRVVFSLLTVLVISILLIARADVCSDFEILTCMSAVLFRNPFFLVLQKFEHLSVLSLVLLIAHAFSILIQLLWFQLSYF